MGRGVGRRSRLGNPLQSWGRLWGHAFKLGPSEEILGLSPNLTPVRPLSQIATACARRASRLRKPASRRTSSTLQGCQVCAGTMGRRCGSRERTSARAPSRQGPCGPATRSLASTTRQPPLESQRATRGAKTRLWGSHVARSRLCARRDVERRGTRLNQPRARATSKAYALETGLEASLSIVCRSLRILRPATLSLGGVGIARRQRRCGRTALTSPSLLSAHNPWGIARPWIDQARLRGLTFVSVCGVLA
mmetsp:Transcript_42562/g.117813  ORF Transcript_42562/g.117813 Transcript_42562/m.117813 type:complete len:250 (-) Transcript_42562:8-757(-)